MESVIKEQSSIKSNDVEAHIARMVEYFYSDRTDLYFKEMPEIECMIKQGEISFSSKMTLQGDQEILKYYKSHPVIHQIYDDTALYDKCLFLEKFIKNTTADSDYYGIKTWFKYEEGKKL